MLKRKTLTKKEDIYIIYVQMWLGLSIKLKQTMNTYAKKYEDLKRFTFFKISNRITCNYT